MLSETNWPAFRFARVLEERKEKLGNLTRLATEIEIVSKLKIDRRKLKRILAGDATAGMTLKDFVAIDAYLTRFGEGLADKPLFDSQWLLTGLVDRGSILMLLGSHPEGADRRANLSRWDLRAANKVTRQIHSAGPTTGVVIDDVVSGPTSPSRDVAEAVLMPEDTTTSVCIIGSPRACCAAELALAEMFGATAFSEPHPGLPFHFVWSKDLTNAQRASAFALDPSVLESSHPDAFAHFSKGDARALVVGDEVYMRRPTAKGKPWNDYGVVVAQRREDGRVYVVLAGLSGPGTFAVAEALVSHRTGTLPHAPKGGGHGSVRWALVEATVKAARAPGDSREVVGTHVLDTYLHSAAEA